MKGGLALVVVAALVVAGAYVAWNVAALHNSDGPIQVVSAENFWGSLVSQIGGSHVSVTSIVTDPNADPHDYESSTPDARAVATARLVVENGAGYDTWCEHLVSANGNPNQIVLNVANLLGKQPGDNPHFWYSPTYVNATARQIYSDLVSIDSAHGPYYQQEYNALEASLGQVDGLVTQIQHRFAGTEVAATESLVVYLANASGLDLVSPAAFMNAVAEGVEPPAQSIVQFQSQLESGNVSVLIYNSQTVVPVTQQMVSIAAQHNVSSVAMTETVVPAGASFQVWMTGELLALENALSQKAPGK